MKPASFTYHAPQTLNEAAKLLKSLSGEDACVLAGGQSLVPMMALRLTRPAHLVDINIIEELGALTNTGDELRIGATVRHARFHSATGLGPLGPLLADVVRHIAHYPIRQRGTFGGSIAHADPASEWCLVAATLGGSMRLISADGAKDVSTTEFFEGAMATTRADDEILCEVALPQINPNTKWAFEEFSMRAGDFAQAMTLVVFDIEDEKMKNARIGVGGIEPCPRRITAAEEILNGSVPTPEILASAAAAVASELEATDDWQGTTADKCVMTGSLVRRTLQAAMEKTF